MYFKSRAASLAFQSLLSSEGRGVESEVRIHISTCHAVEVATKPTPQASRSLSPLVSGALKTQERTKRALELPASPCRP